MPDESFLEDVFGAPPRPQPVPAAAPAPVAPAAFARTRPARPPSRRYGLLVSLLVGLTAVPSWIVLRAGLDGVDPDFGARLAGPLQPFVVPGDHLAPPSLRLPERPVRPAPQADPGLAQAAVHDDEEPAEPPGGNADDPLLEHQAPIVTPPLRPVWRPVAHPPKPGAVRPVPPPAPADPGPAFPGEPSFPGPSFPGPWFPGPSFPGEPSFPGPSLPGGPGLPGGGPLPGGPIPGGPAGPGGPWVPGSHARPDRPHLPWHWHRHDQGSWSDQGEPCEPGGDGDGSGRGRVVVADGLRQPVLARRAAPSDLRGSASHDHARPAVSRLRQGQRGSLKALPGGGLSAVKRKWSASGDGNFWVAKATHGLPSVTRVVPARFGSAVKEVGSARVARVEVTAPEVRTANRREASSPRGKVREATERSGLVARLKPAERRAGGDEEKRQHIRKAKHRKAAEFQSGRSDSVKSKFGKSKFGKSGAGKSGAGGSKARHGDAGAFRHR